MSLPADPAGSLKQGSTSRSLLGLAQGNDPAAWLRLVTLYAPLVAWWCRKGQVAEQDVSDLLQEVFASVAANLARFRKEKSNDSFRGWLATITRNKIVDYQRRNSSQPAAQGGTEAWQRFSQLIDPQAGAADEPEDDRDTEAPIFNQVVCRALESIRSEFQDRTWLAFWEVAVEGRSTADVAAALSMQPAAIRVAKSRVLLRLRKELGDIDL